MVLYDDKKWLCRLIRTAFTIEDDSGFCEKVLKQMPYLESQRKNSDSVSNDESFDIREGADMGHRRRSNTAIRLERLEKQQKALTDTHNIRFNPLEAAKNEIQFEGDGAYEERFKIRSENVVSIKRLLSSVPHPDRVPYSNYAKFEATSQPTAPSKQIAIFLTFLPPEKRAYPIRVSVLHTAKIMDVIGLSLWTTSQQHPEAPLHPVHQYSLQISDEDGEFDDDFPPLDHWEPVGKFSFGYLALTHSENVSVEARGMINLSFLLPDGTVFKLPVDDSEIPIGQLISLVLNKSGWHKRWANNSAVAQAATSYHLEKFREPTTHFKDMSITLSQTKCKDFCVVRNGAKSVQSTPAKNEWSSGTMSNPSDVIRERSDLYPVIVAGRFNKLRNALCVILSGDRMDLEFQSKTKSYPLQCITGVKLDVTKNRVVVSISHGSSTKSASVGSHYLNSTTHLTLMTNELRIATELYHHLNSIIVNK